MSGIYRPLREELRRAALARGVLKGAHELLADELALALRVRDAGDAAQEALVRVDAHQLQLPPGEGGADLLRLVLAHEAVVDVDAGEAAGDGLAEQRGGHGGVHPAGEAQQHAALAHPRADGLHLLVQIARHVVAALRMADAVEEVPDDLPPQLGALGLRVELHGVEPAPFVLHGGHGAEPRGGGDGEALGRARDAVGVAHQHGALAVAAVKEPAVARRAFTAPYSLRSQGDTSPPSMWHMSCIP